MTIWVNQQQQSVVPPITLLTLLEQLQKATQTGIAVALNNQVISKTDWATYNLANNDKITIITATQGG